MPLLRVLAQLAAIAAAVAPDLPAQTPPEVPVTVDDRGVMRWTATGREVALWGVNYSAPFAHAYRAHGYLGVHRKQAIDADVLHFSRLGLDAYRIHVWDREVSDRRGNLLANDHLDLLDYLLSRLAEHGMYTLAPAAAGGPCRSEARPITAGLSRRLHQTLGEEAGEDSLPSPSFPPDHGASRTSGAEWRLSLDPG
jgi:hypothetical protein